MTKNNNNPTLPTYMPNDAERELDSAMAIAQNEWQRCGNMAEAVKWIGKRRALLYIMRSTTPPTVTQYGDIEHTPVDGESGLPIPLRFDKGKELPAMTVRCKLK